MVQENLRQLVEPTLFELSVNYRSHGGIVDAAAYIVSLLNRFFPYSIDRLSRETAKVRSNLCGHPCLYVTNASFDCRLGVLSRFSSAVGQTMRTSRFSRPMRIHLGSESN